MAEQMGLSNGIDTPAQQELPESIQNMMENGKNKIKCRCERCSSLVFSPGMARFARKEVNSEFIPMMCNSSKSRFRFDSDSGPMMFNFNSDSNSTPGNICSIPFRFHP